MADEDSNAKREDASNHCRLLHAHCRAAADAASKVLSFIQQPATRPELATIHAECVRLKESIRSLKSIDVAAIELGALGASAQGIQPDTRSPVNSGNYAADDKGCSHQQSPAADGLTLSEQNVALQQALLEATAKLELMQRRLDDKETQVAVTQQMATADAQGLRKKASTLRSIILQLNREQEAAQRAHLLQVDQLQQALAAVTASARAEDQATEGAASLLCAELQAAHHRFEAEVSAARRECNQLRAELFELRARAARQPAAESQLRHQQDVQVLEEELEELASENANLVRHVLAIQSQCNTMTSGFAQLQAATAAAVAAAAAVDAGQLEQERRGETPPMTMLSPHTLGALLNPQHGSQPRAQPHSRPSPIDPNFPSRTARVSPSNTPAGTAGHHPSGPAVHRVGSGLRLGNGDLATSPAAVPQEGVLAWPATTGSVGGGPATQSVSLWHSEEALKLLYEAQKVMSANHGASAATMPAAGAAAGQQRNAAQPAGGGGSGGAAGPASTAQQLYFVMDGAGGAVLHAGPLPEGATLSLAQQPGSSGDGSRGTGGGRDSSVSPPRRRSRPNPEIVVVDMAGSAPAPAKGHAYGHAPSARGHGSAYPPQGRGQAQPAHGPAPSQPPGPGSAAATPASGGVPWWVECEQAAGAAAHSTENGRTSKIVADMRRQAACTVLQRRSVSMHVPQIVHGPGGAGQQPTSQQ